MLVLEAAAYDVVLVETVGVGQSEVTVAGMVDTFLFLTLARTGDQLQGIKKGILEIADVVAVNKADGEHESEARVGRAASSPVRCAWSAGAPSGRRPVVTCSGADRGRGRRRLASASARTASTSAPTAWRTSARGSSWSSPGPWCATSSTSGCAPRPGSRRCATTYDVPCCRASCPAPLAADRLLAAYDGRDELASGGRTGERTLLGRSCHPQLPATSVIAEVVDKYADELVAFRRDLHAHPELSWAEHAHLRRRS